jgi:hypothetical protein
MRSAVLLFATTIITAGLHIAKANIMVPAAFDTSSLVANPAGPFSLAFVLTDGSGSGDGNNSVTLSNFAFGGGSGGPVTLTAGGATGDPASGVLLTDSSFFNVLVVSFTPGSTLSFLLTLTTNVDPGLTPDQFSFVTLQADGSTLATTDPTGANSLLTINIDSAVPSVSTFQFAAVPEPSTLVLTFAVVAVALVRRCLAPSLRRWPVWIPPVS